MINKKMILLIMVGNIISRARNICLTSVTENSSRLNIILQNFVIGNNFRNSMRNFLPRQIFQIFQTNVVRFDDFKVLLRNNFAQGNITLNIERSHDSAQHLLGTSADVVWIVLSKFLDQSIEIAIYDNNVGSETFHYIPL